MKKIWIGVMAVSATACGGGGLGLSTAPGSTSVSGTASLGGVWNGTVTISGTTDQALALISVSGNGVLIDQSHGIINRISATANGTAVTGSYVGFAPSGTLYPSGGTTETGTLTGTVAAAASLDGTFASPNGNESFGLDFNATQYDQAASVAALVGTYDYNYTTDGTSASYSLTVATNGAITGTVSNGCSLSGSVGIPESTVNLYTLSLTQTCTGSTSTVAFSGFATLMPASGSAAAALTLEYDDGASTAVQAIAIHQ